MPPSQRLEPAEAFSGPRRTIMTEKVVRQLGIFLCGISVLIKAFSWGLDQNIVRYDIVLAALKSVNHARLFWYYGRAKCGPN
jgi:hypothetical protein